MNVTLESGGRGKIVGLMDDPGHEYNVELRFKGNDYFNPTQKTIPITYYPQD
jgi:hypothetical protein